nr:(d)CMP kinase [Chloroflexota bacterium]
GKVVMVGRDIGSVVVPNAGLKIFLRAGLAERARRRHAELIARGDHVSLTDVLTDLEARDEIDVTRTAAPLRVAEGAAVIDTDGRSIPEIVSEIDLLARQVWERDPNGVEEASPV